MIKLDFDVFDLIDRHKSGESIKKLSEETGITRKTITQRMVSVGFVPRTRSEAMFVRMANTPAEERARLTSAAHEACKGREQSIDEKVKRAITKESKGRFDSRVEEVLAQMLCDRGFTVTPQKAIGIYNVDLAVDGTAVIVEGFGGGWHSSGKHLLRHRQRFDYLLNLGYFPIIVWINGIRSPLESGAADYIVSRIEEVCGTETMWSHEQMIRGNGDIISSYRIDNNDLTGIIPPNTRDNVTGRFVSRSR